MLTGTDGSSAQCIEDLAIYRAVPNMVVMYPADVIEAEKSVKLAVKHKGPMYIRLGRSKIPVIYNKKKRFELGKGDILKKGNDVTIIACGPQVYMSLEASEKLKQQGISAAVVNMSTIKPIDKKLIIQLAKKTKAIVTAEDHNILGGLGGAVSEVLTENYPIPLERVGVKDTFGESGNPDELYKKYGLDSVAIVKAAKKVIKRKQVV